MTQQGGNPQEFQDHRQGRTPFTTKFDGMWKIQAEIARIIEEYAKKRFDLLLKQRDIDTDCAFYTPEKKTYLSILSPEHFQKHLFERAGNMNGEETELAMRIDALDNVAWWLRNREKEDFYIQGWKPGKFYPDFIVKTKTGSYILVEYKGEDRLTNEDTEYKIQLGKLWEKLSDDKNKFYLVNVKSSDEVLKQISNMA